MIGTILAPTDGSDHANKAIGLAADLAAKYGSHLVLLHVVASGELAEALRHEAEVEHVGVRPHGAADLVAAIPEAKFPSSMRSGREEIPLELLELVGKHVLDEAKKLAKSHGARDVRTIADDGNPARSILKHARNEKADMIVMGNRGLSDLTGLVLGSVSRRVSHLADCTCVTVT